MWSHPQSHFLQVIDRTSGRFMVICWCFDSVSPSLTSRSTLLWQKWLSHFKNSVVWGTPSICWCVWFLHFLHGINWKIFSHKFIFQRFIFFCNNTTFSILFRLEFCFRFSITIQRRLWENFHFFQKQNKFFVRSISVGFLHYENQVKGLFSIFPRFPSIWPLLMSHWTVSFISPASKLLIFYFSLLLRGISSWLFMPILSYFRYDLEDIIF